MTSLRVFLTGLLVAALLVPIAPPATAVAQVAPPEAFDCPPGLVTGEPLPDRISCAHVTVPLRHAVPDGDTIRLATARIAPAVETDAPPLLLLGGGPGGPMLPLAELFVLPTPYARLAEEREVILLDQRGVGLSMPALDCPNVLEIQAGVDDDSVLASLLEAIGACRDELTADGVELGAFNTAENARDVGLVVEAFGHDSVDLYGVSYGTTLGLQVAKSEPDWLRTLTLDSPIDPTANFVTEVALGFDAALELTDAACGAEPACLSDGGPLSERLAAAVEDLTAEPMAVSLPGPDGQQTEVPLGGVDAVSLVFLTYYSGDLLQQLPALVRAFEERNGAFIAALLGPLLEQQMTAGNALGMQLSVLCAEEVAASSPESATTAAAGTRPLVRDVWHPNQPIVGLPIFDICARWDVPAADDERFDPVAVDVPLLLAVGSYDHITPARYGEAILEDAADARLVEFTDQGHSPLLAAGPCGIGLLLQFLQAPAEELVTGCADDPSPFAPRPTTRIAGADRVATAVAASQDRFADGAAGGAVLAAAGSFPDALTGAALAVELDAPLLLTPPSAPDGSALHPAVAGELQRALPESATVTVLGGTAALPESVADAVRELGFRVERVGGANRFETAVAIAERLGRPGDVVLATGHDFADPLVAAPLAAAEGRALLLTAGDQLPPATAAYLAQVETATVLAVGGPAATAAPDAEPLVGANRFATAAAVAQERFPEATAAGLASGGSYADAATGGTHIAAMGGPLLLTPSDQLSLDAAFAIGTSPTLERLYVYGGTAVIPDVLLVAYDSTL